MKMNNYIGVSIVGGLSFGIMDGVINANPLAQRLYEVYRPIAKTAINAPVGLVIDLIYGFVMAGTFLLFYKCLPGKTGLLKGLSFGLMVWFFRVVMATVSQGMMFNIPINTLAYGLVTGLIEMMVLGVLWGRGLKV